MPSYADGSERNLAVPFQRSGDSLAERRSLRLSSAALLSTPPWESVHNECYGTVSYVIPLLSSTVSNTALA